MFLVFFYAVFLVVAIYTLRRELLSPTFLVALTFAIGLFDCYVFRSEWQLNFSPLTLLIIAIGLTACFLGELVAAGFSRGKGTVFRQDISAIRIENYKLIIFLAFELITLFLYYKEVKRIAGGASTFALMMNQYKNAIYDTAALEDNVNSFIKQMAKVSFAGTACFAFVFINNLLSKEKVKRNIKYLLPTIVYLGQSVISSARSLFLQLAIAILVYFYFIYKFKHGWNKPVSFKVIRRSIIFGAIILLAFWASKELVGRVTQKQAFFEYIAYYFAGGIAFFDKYIKNPYSNFQGIIGAETFPGLLGFISKFAPNLNVVGNLEFRYSGTIHGNTYTAYRQYYNDFGIAGVFILEFIFSFIYTKWIRKVKYSNSNQIRHIIVFGAFAYPLFYGTIAAQFYRLVVSINGLTNYLFILLTYYFIFKLKIRMKRRY